MSNFLYWEFEEPTRLCIISYTQKNEQGRLGGLLPSTG